MENQRIANFKAICKEFEYDDGLLITNNVNIDFLNQNIEIWIDKEDNSKSISKKQLFLEVQKV